MSVAPIVSARVSTPVGELDLASDGRALVAVGLRTGSKAFRADVEARTGQAVTAGSDKILDRAASELASYFDGRTKAFDVPIRFAWGTPFQQRVWKAIAKVPFGESTTYGALAVKVGSPGGFQAVGQATGANPLGVIVPCHRVLQASGRMGGYGGGEDMKEWLLRHEGAAYRP